MADERDRRSEADEPFRESESGADYNPQGNWGAERRLDGPSGGVVRGPEGAASGAGDGGFGPEGDYTESRGRRNAGEAAANAGPDALIDEAQRLGKPRPGRSTTDGTGDDRKR
ncbi:MAG TPA: hypothetical protein VHB25_19425 [Gemmatimonadaceae bacterium]|nr:hypothetical protein [Gemmatimonadaceae bacterium]